MDNLNFDPLKLENQLCFPLYAASREVIKLYKNNQYGRYLQDVLDGKYLDVIRDKKRLEKLEAKLEEK